MVHPWSEESCGGRATNSYSWGFFLFALIDGRWSDSYLLGMDNKYIAFHTGKSFTIIYTSTYNIMSIGLWMTKTSGKSGWSTSVPTLFKGLWYDYSYADVCDFRKYIRTVSKGSQLVTQLVTQLSFVPVWRNLPYVDVQLQGCRKISNSSKLFIKCFHRAVGEKQPFITLNS